MESGVNKYSQVHKEKERIQYERERKIKGKQRTGMMGNKASRVSVEEYIITLMTLHSPQLGFRKVEKC